MQDKLLESEKVKDCVKRNTIQVPKVSKKINFIDLVGMLINDETKRI